jgi:sigma-B regulation protein RsbU (phosphoserine phosphatase)
MSDTVRSDGRFDRTPPLRRRRLARAETWAGNERTAALVEMPGLVAWVHSVPSDSGAGGGDVHYLSVCPSGNVSRIALADVSGHGQAVVRLGEKLRELMLRHLPALEQVGLMRDLSRAVREELDGVHYATMIAVGWHGPRRLLVVTNAGHPPPCWYRAALGQWSWIGVPATERGRTVGVPLGLLADSHYNRAVLKPQVGDLVVLYTDGVSEASNEVGDELGSDGLMRIAREMDASSAEAFGSQLAAALGRFRGRAEPADDQTVIVLECVALTVIEKDLRA